MQKYFGVVQTASGAAVANAAVAVQLYPAGTVAAVYSDNGVTSTANPLTTDTQGNYAFYAADGRYQLVISRSGITTSTVLDIMLDDPANASPVVASTLTVTGAATVGAGLAVTGALSASGAVNFGSGAVQTDASGNLGLGVTPSAWAAARKAIELGGISQIVSTSQTLEIGSNWFNNGVYIYKTSNVASLYSPSNGAHTWFTAPSGTAGNPIAFTQSLQLGKGTALTLEGGTSTAGTGIAFPATQLPSANPNTLDDYAEGNWTPNQGAGLTVVGAFSSTGTYTKVGRQVTVQGQMNAVTSIATSAGGIVCSNLPFTTVNGFCGAMSNGPVSATSVIVVFGVTASSTAVIPASAGVTFSVTYFV